MMRARTEIYARSVPMLEGIGRFIDRHELATELFRAHIDIYVRTLRADCGRLKAALALDRRMVAAMTKGVRFKDLLLKQKIYYLALRILPAASYMLP